MRSPRKHSMHVHRTQLDYLVSASGYATMRWMHSLFLHFIYWTHRDYPSRELLCVKRCISPLAGFTFDYLLVCRADILTKNFRELTKDEKLLITVFISFCFYWLSNYWPAKEFYSKYTFIAQLKKNSDHNNIVIIIIILVTIRLSMTQSNGHRLSYVTPFYEDKHSGKKYSRRWRFSPPSTFN